MDGRAGEIGEVGRNRVVSEALKNSARDIDGESAGRVSEIDLGESLAVFVGPGEAVESLGVGECREKVGVSAGASGAIWSTSLRRTDRHRLAYRGGRFAGCCRR